MPVYEYACTACGHPVEVMHSFTAPGPQVCERCGAPMRKTLSTPAIVFKGSGWAKKDHRDKVHAASKATPVAPAAPASAASDTATATAPTATASDGGGAGTSASPGTSASTATASPVTPVAASAATPPPRTSAGAD